MRTEGRLAKGGPLRVVAIGMEKLPGEEGGASARGGSDPVIDGELISMAEV